MKSFLIQLQRLYYFSLFTKFILYYKRNTCYIWLWKIIKRCVPDNQSSQWRFELVTTIFNLNAVERKSITKECVDFLCETSHITTWIRFSVLLREA